MPISGDQIKNMNYQQLHEAVKNGSIVSALDTSGKKHRFFISDSGDLCRFKSRSRRQGYRVNEAELARYTRLIPFKQAPTGDERLRKEYRLIEKYKRMAGEAGFTNHFIRDCLALPDFDAWRKEANAEYGLNEALIPVIRLYDLRHTCATLLLKALVPVKVVSERLGHRDPAMTLRVYQHVIPAQQKEATGIMERLMLGHGKLSA